MTAIIVIDGARALALLREVVADKGADFVYQGPRDEDSCRYEVDGECACVVGYALHKAGVTVEQLAEMDADFTTEISEVELPDGVDLTDDARSIFCAAQDVQDSLNPWGRALAAAEELAADFGAMA